jgi:hypothetical protein
MMLWTPERSRNLVHFGSSSCGIFSLQAEAHARVDHPRGIEFARVPAILSFDFCADFQSGGDFDFGLRLLIGGTCYKLSRDAIIETSRSLTTSPWTGFSFCFPIFERFSEPLPGLPSHHIHRKVRHFVLIYLYILDYKLRIR